MTGDYQEWHQEQYDLYDDERSARGKLAEVCRYGNIWDNACDIVDDLVANPQLFIDACIEAGTWKS